MPSNRKQQIVRLLKGIESGDPESVSVVNKDKYIQHNPQTHEGSAGLKELFRKLSETNPKVNIVRVFEDNDFVFAHTEYDFSNQNVGFEVFRFEGDLVVEHWDNIQQRLGPNPSGHTMVDGATEVSDLDKTETNRQQVQSFVDDVLIQRKGEKLFDYIKWNGFTEHNPYYSDDVDGPMAVLSPASEEHSNVIRYQKCHRVLAEGNFVLSVCEGMLGDTSAAFYDLYRLEHDWIVEHWDTTEAIPPNDAWKNKNGKF
jgi:predicted SnoaL-like aldol condensation-catalyzing enzyme